MQRTITLSDVKQAVDEAYEQFKSLKEGAIDASNVDAPRADTFGISVVLADGRRVDKADTDALFTLGSIVRIPVAAVLFSQNDATKVVSKMRCGSCCCAANKPELPFCLHGLRAVAQITPQGDPEGKFALINDMIYAMANNAGTLSDATYKAYQAQEAAATEAINNAGLNLGDDVAQSVDLYSRLLSLKMSTRDLATMGATIAADGRNPLTGVPAFDAAVAPSVVAMMATHGKKFIKPWLMETGLPARRSKSGAIVAVLPGFGAIVAYSPLVDERGVSVKAAEAIKYIARKLKLNVFASERTVVAQ